MLNPYSQQSDIGARPVVNGIGVNIIENSTQVWAVYNHCIQQQIDLLRLPMEQNTFNFVTGSHPDNFQFLKNFSVLQPVDDFMKLPLLQGKQGES